MECKGKYYLTTAIAYTSAKPHIGNNYEIVLADSIARFKRKEGYDVFFQTGTDEHGQKIELKAEAAGILKKAEAMKQYGDAARQQMELDTLKVYFEQLPKIAEAVAKGYMNVDSIKMFGGDSSKLAGDIMTTVTQVTDGIKESTGLDINEMLAKGFAKEKAEDTKPVENVEKNDTGNDYQEV